MKFVFLSLIALASFASCDIRNANKKDIKHRGDSTAKGQMIITDSTTVELIDSVYNFGEVTDGAKVEYSFRFRNTGKNPLIVQDASASCGCTVPEKPDEPIPPGQIGTIKVVFNSKGRAGSTLKEITVVSNANPEFPKMKLTGTVLNKK